LRKYCIIGNPVSHSKSPQIYDYIFRQLNIDAKYELSNITSNVLFKDFIANTKNYVGYNITSPYKDLAYSLIDEAHNSACLVNAVNCIKIIDNKLIGYNTDYYGFKKLIEQQKINFNDKKFLILGNGATAKTISQVLINLYNPEIYIWGRNKNHVNNFIDFNNNINNLNAIRLYKKTEVNKYILINCLPFTIKDCDVKNIFDNILFKNIELLIDVNYINNILIDRITRLNIKTISGKDMLLYQALQNLDFWFDGKYSNKIDFKTLKQTIF